MTLRPYRSTADAIARFPSEEELRKVPLEDRLSAIIVAARGQGAGPSERKSWDVSLPILAKLLVEANLGQVEMLIEYPMPETDARADVVLAGIHPETGADSYLVVELKQWDEAVPVWDTDHLVQGPKTHGIKVHPVAQVRGYCTYLLQYVEVLRTPPATLYGIAYLHNATEASVRKLRTAAPDDLGRLFTGEEREALKEYLRGKLSTESGAPAGKRLQDSPIQPRQQLTQIVTAGLRGESHYSLIGNQLLAYEHVVNQVKLAFEEDQKKVIIVTGGPGTGKSLIAASLVMDLHEEYRVRFSSGSITITETMRRFASKVKPGLKNLFTYYRDFSGAKPNSVDVLLCDEAHRVRKTSTYRRQKKELRTDRPQLDELMSAARVPVFFLDEHQVIRPDEVGTLATIMAQAARKGYSVQHIELDKQFRSRGSAAYQDWVLRLVGLRSGPPALWQGDDFDVRVASSPQEMETFLREKNRRGYTARIAAGYCWPWSGTRPDGTLVHDVQIDDWSMPWNKKDPKVGGEAPPSALWATDPRGFGQIGCIYTAQGLEYDWAGVILGEDIVFDGRYLAVRREFNQDPALRGTKKEPYSDAQIERVVRNIYHVLLTRGLLGVVIYAVDPATRKFISQLAGPLGSIGPATFDAHPGVDIAWRPKAD